MSSFFNNRKEIIMEKSFYQRVYTATSDLYSKCIRFIIEVSIGRFITDFNHIFDYGMFEIVRTYKNNKELIQSIKNNVLFKLTDTNGDGKYYLYFYVFIQSNIQDAVKNYTGHDEEMIGFLSQYTKYLTDNCFKELLYSEIKEYVASFDIKATDYEFRWTTNEKHMNLEIKIFLDPEQVVMSKEEIEQLINE